MKVSDNCLHFLEVFAKANLPDIGDSNSIGNIEMAGTTISTSTGLGYRCLNSNRSWMFGMKAGDENRPMATGPALQVQA